MQTSPEVVFASGQRRGGGEAGVVCELFGLLFCVCGEGEDGAGFDLDRGPFDLFG